MGFLIPKIYQILKHFSRNFHRAQTLKLLGVSNGSSNNPINYFHIIYPFNIGSQDHLNNFAKPNLMIRNNPIGLPEPSVKRDGYAVGKDGSFYRSSENLFENGAKNGESTSATPDRDLNGYGNRKDQRRSSTSSTGSDSGVRAGGGLIQTGRPVKQNFLPFGATMSALASKPNYVISKKGSSRSRSQSQSRQQQQIQKNTSNNTNSSTNTNTTVQNPSLVMTCSRYMNFRCRSPKYENGF